MYPKFALWVLRTESVSTTAKSKWIKLAQAGSREVLEGIVKDGYIEEGMGGGSIKPDEYAIIPEGANIKLVPEEPKISFCRFVDRMTPEQIANAETLNASFAVTGPKSEIDYFFVGERICLPNLPPSLYHDLHSAIMSAAKFYDSHPDGKKISVWICCKDIQSVIQ